MKEQVKMSDENIIYCLQTLAGFEPNDIDCDYFDIAVNDDQFATISIVETARLGYELTEKQKELIAKQADQIKIVKNQIAKIIMLYKQSNLDSDTSMMASIELEEFIESLSATEQK